MKNSMTYIYTNKDGRKKSLMVHWVANEEHKHYCVLRDLATSEFCGSTYKTVEEILNFLRQQKVEYAIWED